MRREIARLAQPVLVRELVAIAHPQRAITDFNKAVRLRSRPLSAPWPTLEGRQRLTRLVVGRLFADPQDLELAPLDLRAKLERLVGSLARIEDRVEWSLTELTKEAARALTEAKVRHIRDLGQLFAQRGLFKAGAAPHSERALRLARKLQEPPLRAAAAFRQYARDADLERNPTLGFLTAPTPEEEKTRTQPPFVR